MREYVRVARVFAAVAAVSLGACGGESPAPVESIPVRETLSSDVCGGLFLEEAIVTQLGVAIHCSSGSNLNRIVLFDDSAGAAYLAFESAQFYISHMAASGSLLVFLGAPASGQRNLYTLPLGERTPGPPQPLLAVDAEIGSEVFAVSPAGAYFFSQKAGSSTLSLNRVILGGTGQRASEVIVDSVPFAPAQMTVSTSTVYMLNNEPDVQRLMTADSLQHRATSDVLLARGHGDSYLTLFASLSDGLVWYDARSEPARTVRLSGANVVDAGFPCPSNFASRAYGDSITTLDFGNKEPGCGGLVVTNGVKKSAMTIPYNPKHGGDLVDVKVVGTRDDRTYLIHEASNGRRDLVAFRIDPP